jgi:hypothetical protein
MKYKLTFWQRLELIPVWFMWITTDKNKRKSWHALKKGSEKHEHKFTVMHTEHYNGKHYHFMKCNHEGCNFCEPID